MGACAFNYEAIQIPSDEFSEGIAFVPKQIAGVSLLLREDGRPKLGAVHPLGPGTVGGRHGIRTHDPHVANVVLSQLS